MRRIPISFLPTSSKGEQPQTGGARLVNAISEQLEDGRVIIKRAPGLTRLFQSFGGNSHCRGMIGATSGTLLVVYDGAVESVIEVSGALVVTELGALAGTDLVTLARNNNATPEIACISPSNGPFELFAASAPAAYPDVDIGVPVSICFTGGYFFAVYGGGTCRASGLNTTAINAADETRAESHSGGLVRGVAHAGRLLLFGPSSCEPWQGDQPNASGFPFNRSAVIERGLASVNAISGWEDNFASALIWAGADNVVYHLRGDTPYRISTPTIERDLQNLSDKTTLRAFCAMHSGHPYWFLKSQTFTHVYDLLTSTWHERKSYGLERFRAEQSHHMFGDWIVGDELTGDCYRLDADSYLEGTEPVVFEVESTVTQAFPMRKGVKRMDLNFVATAPTPDTDANVLISWSQNGGTDWSTPIQRTLWREGRLNEIVSIRGCGHIGPHGYKVKVLVSDPVYVGLLGGVLHVED